MNLKFQNWALKTKLLALCAILSGVTAAVGGVGFFSLKDVGTEYGFITAKVMPKLERVNQLEIDFNSVRMGLRVLALTGLSPAEIQAEIHETEATIKHYEKTAEEYRALGFIPGQKERYETVDKAWQEFRTFGVREIGLITSNRPADREETLKLFLKDGPERAKNYAKASTALSDFHHEVGKIQVQKAESAAARANLLSLFLMLGGLTGGMILGYLTAKRITAELAQVADTLARGSTEISHAVTQLSAASEKFSASTTQQAASIQETAASIEEINAMVKKNTDSAVDSARVAGESRAHAERGKAAVEMMQIAMDDIQRSNGTIQTEIQKDNERIGEIIKMIQEIGSKTRVINDIVFQTKLLSFNASVEAARAGEHGKGFAVVAEEVGNLAQMSGNAAKEISTLLDESVAKVETIVRGTKEKVERLMLQARSTVERGGQTTKDCELILEKILENATLLSEMVTSISTASHEQSNGVNEISKAIHELDRATQMNAAANQQTSSSTASLSNQIQSLKSASDQIGGVVAGKGNTRLAIAGQHPRKTEPLRKAATPFAPKSVPAPALAKNVLALRPKKALHSSPAAAVPAKKVVGGESVPSAHDPRFEDV